MLLYWQQRVYFFEKRVKCSKFSAIFSSSTKTAKLTLSPVAPTLIHEGRAVRIVHYIIKQSRLWLGYIYVKKTMFHNNKLVLKLPNNAWLSIEETRPRGDRRLFKISQIGKN